MVDKNLFLYDLAVVAIMKNEEPYVKEWLDYHLLAGVDHFYIYDNDSTPEFKKILQPYIDAGIVTYTPITGKAQQYVAYNDAVNKYKFFCRYMTFIDADEFIFPKSQPTIAGVADEVLMGQPGAAALGAHWHIFGSNHHKKVDYSKGVLDRFTRRAPNDWYLPPKPPENRFHQGNVYVKSILNPRLVRYFDDSHRANYFFGCFTVDEARKILQLSISFPVVADKIVVNHYQVKSLEEYKLRQPRGDVNKQSGEKYNVNFFKDSDRNEEFDDGILKYRESRITALIPSGGIEGIIKSKKDPTSRLFNALAQNLIPLFVRQLPPQFFFARMENFLTCYKLNEYLKENFLNEKSSVFEEISLGAICQSLKLRFHPGDFSMLLNELPKILTLPYPVVKELRETCLKIIPQIMKIYQVNNHWQGATELDYILKMLKTKN